MRLLAGAFSWRLRSLRVIGTWLKQMHFDPLPCVSRCVEPRLSTIRIGHIGESAYRTNGARVGVSIKLIEGYGRGDNPAIIAVSTKLMEFVQNRDASALNIDHELGHITNGLYEACNPSGTRGKDDYADAHDIASIEVCAKRRRDDATFFG